MRDLLILIRPINPNMLTVEEAIWSVSCLYFWYIVIICKMVLEKSCVFSYSYKNTILQLGSAELFMKETKFLIYGNGKDQPPTGFMFEKQQMHGLYFNQSPSKVLLQLSLLLFQETTILESLSYSTFIESTLVLSVFLGYAFKKIIN